MQHERAAATAKEAVELAKASGEKQTINTANLVLAEIHFREDQLEKCERELQEIEEKDLKSDYFVLGNIQRIRGLIALSNNTTKS